MPANLTHFLPGKAGIQSTTPQ